MTDQAKETDTVKKKAYLQAFGSSHITGHPSITTEDRGFLLQTSEAMENVTTTLLIEGLLNMISEH